MKNSPGRRLRCWRARWRSSHASARHCAEPCAAQGQLTPGKAVCGQTGAGDLSSPDTAAGENNAPETTASRAAVRESVTAATQAAIGLLTASLDSPELEAWALPALIPHDADGLGELMAGLHLISELLIRELHEATGEPPQATLQRLAIMAEHRRGMSSAD